MSSLYNFGNSDAGGTDDRESLSPRQDQATECLSLVHETVCVQANAKITPAVTVGNIESFCVGGPVIGRCPGTPSLTNSCTFTVSQNICVQVPLTFSAAATASPSGIVCGTPANGTCPSTTGCTLTIGFYKNHPDVTNALITAAGGSIVLGIDSQGASFTVTTANADAVLSFNTPSPPAPSTEPFKSQYENLYAQLLGAELNLLNGASCPFATDAIAAANSFLATSPAGVGKEGAPLVQAPLEQFNSGTAPGCPTHCS